MARWCAHMLLIGVAYALAGRFGQYLAAPPIYATAVWPASGIALAGLLLLGFRVWPGLFLGAWIVNSWSSLIAASSVLEIGQALLPAAVISVGSTLQAVVGAGLIRHYVGFPNNLSRERDILAFFGLGGPLACVIGATLGVGSLIAAGTIPSSQASMNWWTWWVGDVIGVVIFAPLTLIFWAEPQHVWRGRRLSVAVPLGITLATLAIAFTYSYLAQRQENRLKFQRRVSYVFENLEENIDRSLELLHSMQAFHAGSQEVTRDEFEVFHQHLLTRHAEVQALEWIPRVPHAQRAEYETAAREEGLTDFQFTQKSAGNSLVAAAIRDEYFPVYHVVPYEGNEAALGFDLGSDAARLRALIEACDTGRQVATAPIRLVQEPEQQAGILVLMPVYANDRPTESLAQRRRNLTGFVLAVLRVGDIVTATLPSVHATGFELTIVDDGVDAEYRELYHSGNDNPQYKKVEPLSALSREIHWTTSLSLAGRTWTFRFEPNSRFFANEADNDVLFVLAGGLLFTSLLGVILMVLSGRANQVEELVVERTAELTTANRALEGQIAARKRFEAALSVAQEELEQRVEQRTADLKASEMRYQDLYDNAPDMFASVNVATQRLTECNHTFLVVTGFEKHEVIGRPIPEIYAEDSLQVVSDAFQLFLKTGQVKDLELKLLRKHQEPLPVSLNVSAVRDQQGQLLFSRAVLRDISEQKNAEAKIKRHESELAHVARLSTMGEMAAGLAHEINQPLAAIAAYANGVAIRLRNDSIDAHQLLDVVGDIAADAHRAGEVIRRLRQFVRNREPDRVPVDINMLATEVSQFVASDAAQRQIRVRLELAAELPLAWSDAIEFQQVLLNLVRNGFDAMVDTPVKDRRLVIRTKQVAETIEVVVEDCGHGLPPGSSEELFEAFFTSKEEGLGMGLAISRTIVESHGGRIWATSSVPDKTSVTRFHFTMRVAGDDGTSVVS